MKTSLSYIVRIATPEDFRYIPEIVNEMAISATQRKVAKGQRSTAFIKQKIKDGLAVIALLPDKNEWIGFSYLEVWQHKKYIATSGLIISPQYRGQGFSKKIKKALFSLSRKTFPEAKMLSLTTHPAVIHANKDLGYKEVSFQDIINDQWFQEGGNSWIDYKELMNSKEKEHQYVAMVYEP